MDRIKNDLWSYVQEDSAADAFLLAVAGDAKWQGHERFYVIAPEISHDHDSDELRRKHWPDVPLKNGTPPTGRQGFFDTTKAETILGWKHQDVPE